MILTLACLVHHNFTLCYCTAFLHLTTYILYYQHSNNFSSHSMHCFYHIGRTDLLWLIMRFNCTGPIILAASLGLTLSRNPQHFCTGKVIVETSCAVSANLSFQQFPEPCRRERGVLVSLKRAMCTYAPTSPHSHDNSNFLYTNT
jgi:hypothetical protein